jgi:hypothetical protein
LIGAALLIPSGTIAAQVRSVVPMPRDSLRGRPDTTRVDSVRADTTALRELVKWIEADSVTRALMARPGFSATRYQGSKVVFRAQSRTLEMEGDRAAVGRDQTLLVADTITYNDSTKIIFARGDTVVLRDPQQAASDVIALGRMTYNVDARRGTVTNISTSVETGQTWYLGGREAAFVGDTTRGGQTAFYARDGIITSCDDDVPDYHFQAKEVKLVSKNILVARPAVLYIGDVPVMWLPFIFQDMRSGRRSGVLTPRFGVSELFRNSPTYRRHVENLGYYFAISDYMDAELSFDWRSGSRPSAGDPGWVRLGGIWQYRWLDRFLSGGLRMQHHSQRDGSKNTSVSWNHSQSFSQATSLSANINFVTNTTVQRTTTFDPRQVLATIGSTANYQTQFGQTRVSVGGSRTQYPGRKQLSQSLPNFSISSPTVSVTPWLDWTPAFNISNAQEFNIDQAGEFRYRYFNALDGTRDSAERKRDYRNTAGTFSTPIKIGGFTLNTTFRGSDIDQNYPSTVIFVDPADTSRRISRVFARRFRTDFDWQSSFGLPSIGQGVLNLSPGISFQNVHPEAYWVRTELSGGRFVHQSKRAIASLGVSPTLFALFPGFGSVSRFRHSINPMLTYSYAPKATVSEEYLRALNTNPAGYLGANAQNMLTLGLSHVLEAKLATTDTTGTVEPKKVKVLSMTFSSLAYDFERARQTGRSGFATDRFSYNVVSDLLPGFNGSVGYSLYEGSILSDSARFKPYRETINLSFSLNSQSGIFAALNRVFGRAVRQGTPSIERVTPSADDAQANAVASTPSAGASVRNRQLGVPATRGWQAQFTFSSQRQRPPTGGGTVIEHDPTEICQAYQVNPIQYQQCLEVQSNNPTGGLPIPGTTAGGPFIRTPPRDNLQSQMSFNITPKWSASWGTNYDFNAAKFGSHAVTLQRQLHDWTSIFSFNQAPNGNFAFSFFIALNAQPDLKFNYDKQTYRPVTR